MPSPQAVGASSALDENGLTVVWIIKWGLGTKKSYLRTPIAVTAVPQASAGQRRCYAAPSPPEAQLGGARPIARAALTSFAEKGCEATSVEAIASRAGCPWEASISASAQSESFLLALMDQLLDRLERLDLRPKGASNIREGLRAVLQRAFSRDLAHARAYRAWREPFFCSIPA